MIWLISTILSTLIVGIWFSLKHREEKKKQTKWLDFYAKNMYNLDRLQNESDAELKIRLLSFLHPAAKCTRKHIINIINDTIPNLKSVEVTTPQPGTIIINIKAKKWQKIKQQRIFDATQTIKNNLPIYVDFEIKIIK